MRKLFFLTMTTVLLGAFANVYGQCTESEMSPAAGVPHVYEVSVSGDGYNVDGTTGVYNWYVTKDADNLLNGAMADDSDFKAIAGGDFSAYNSTADDPTTTHKLKLTWKTEAIASGDPYFLVLKYTGSNGVCNAMNMKVMKIQPLNQFKLNIVPVQDEAGTLFDAAKEICAADVDGATYDSNDHKVIYTYGENTLYYKITASGFAGKWKPLIKLPALDGAGAKQKYVSAQWKDAAGTWHDFENLQQDGSEQALTSADLAEIPTVEGTTPTQDYIVRVIIDNERFENLSGQDIEVATDGTYGGADATVLKDRKDDCSADEDAFGDKGAIKIKARPQLTATSGVFVEEIH